MKLLSKKSPPIEKNSQHIDVNVSTNDKEQNVHGVNSSIFKNINEKQANTTKISDQKRLNSLLAMRTLYRQKINTVKIALTNVDTKGNNKVIFDDDGQQEENNLDSSINSKSEYNTDKRMLFQDNDEEDITYNFEAKEQYQGQKGKKLMELQLKFRNDKRFTMDERFLEDDNCEEKVAEQRDNEGMGQSVYSKNNASGMDVTSEEKQKELSILEEVLGKKVKNKDKESSKNKATNYVGMVRYDPANPEHSKYVLQQTEVIKGKTTKKRKLIDSSFEDLKLQKPTVSKETFYEVKENLKETLKEDKPFSLLTLFNNRLPTNQVPNSSPTETEEIIKTDGVNPFCYDSSDDENSHDKNQADNVDKNISNYLQLGAAKLWREPFFFKVDDYRFQEGIDFIRKFTLDDKMEFKQVRKNIKEIVRAKIRNNQRKNKPFRKKLGGKRMIKIKNAMKNR